MDFPLLTMIKKRRQAVGKTQKELASLCGIGQGYLTKIERSVAVPSYPIAVRIFQTIEKLESGATESIIDLPASKAMTSNVITARPEAHAEAVVGLMLKRNISQLPVIDHNGHVIGTVTEKSLLGKTVRGKSVREIMDSRALVSVSKDTRLSIVRAILAEEPAVLVIEKSKTVGIITKHDLIRSSVRNV